MTLRSVFLLLGGATLDVVIFYCIRRPVLCCVLDACLALLSFGVVVRVFLELEMSMVLYVLVPEIVIEF